MEVTLVDAGPLVALLDEKDKWHRWAVGEFKKLQPPLLTCEAVLSEAWFLLQNSPPAHKGLNLLHSSGVLRLDFDFEQEASAVWLLLAEYADTPMDFVDACIVRMSELRTKVRVWTIDAHFRVYRRNRRQSIPLLFPELRD